ncbi:MAG TPA: acyl-CoA dehydrogenase family protein [Pseudonocardiaceae bacterium]|jgi:acyl-CoA dehydrogenase/citronellyl-CoA dehydrogenase|nr:acyl-CoA dehydrogenase family protein [Pseudonocardiaceae bacterium]
MDWDLDAEHRDFQATCRAFVDKHVRPVVDEAEQAGRPPAELWTELGAAGLLGLMTPEEYGGSGGDQLAVALVAEELSRASGGIAVSALVSAYMAGTHIVYYGSAEQRARYLPGIASGELIAAIAVTEPGAGSDVAGITSTAVRTETGYRLNGRKMFITNAGLADVLIVGAKTEPEAGRHGVTTFLVDAGTPGLSFGSPLVKMGWHSSDTREVIIDDLELPPEAVLGEMNRGFHQIMGAFQLERVSLAAMGLGHGAECLQLATEHVRIREAFGSRLADLQTVRHRLARMAVELESARVMTYRAAVWLGAGHPDTARAVAMAKYHAALAADHVVDDAVQLLGGAGFVEESAVARHYRDARILRIGGGTDEIQLEILARELRS